jgi:hypothetical protein
MDCQKKYFVLAFLLFGLASVAFAEDYDLQYYLAKTSAQASELSQKERGELLSRMDEVMKKAQQIHMKLIQAIQTGEVDIQYQEGRFWMSKLEQDEELIENGIQQIQQLKEKPTHLVASIKLYKALKDMSSHFNAYNNLPSFSSVVGDFAPEMELWADPIFYKLYLLPLAQLKDAEKVLPEKKKADPKNRKP